MKNLIIGAFVGASMVWGCLLTINISSAEGEFIFASDLMQKEEVVSKMFTDTSRVTWVSDYDEVQKAFDDYFINYGVRIKGLATYTSEKCTIYAHEPEYVGDDRTRTLGHELLHCMRGAYHD